MTIVRHMTIRHDPPAGAPIWVDLMSSDRDASEAFYTGLLGWVADDPNPEFGGYTNVTLAGEAVAGLMPAQDVEACDAWMVYLNVADAEGAVAAVKGAGGTVIVEPMPIADLGVMAVVLDPGGSAVGMWQPGEHRGGVVATVGAPCHFELQTDAYDAVLPFYRDVFGWTLSEQPGAPDFRYTLYEIADGESAGIMDASVFPPEAPRGWTVYFAVDDVEAALATTVELGGRVSIPAESTPYGVLAEAYDSTGARFKLRAD